MARVTSAAISGASDAFIAERLQSILINAAEGRRSIGDDSQYAVLRREFLRRFKRSPPLVETHPTTDSFTAYIKGIKNKSERVNKVRTQFASILNSEEADETEGIPSQDWTGVENGGARLRTVRQLIPLAQAAVEGMIAALSDTGGNGAPLLDEKAEAVENLRLLHRALGDLLAAADSGHLDDKLGQGFAAEAARYAKRAAKALKHDPMPYLASGLLNGILAACGFPAIGGFLGGIAQNIRRNVSDKTV